MLLTIQRDLSNIRVVVLASAVDFCPGKVADDAWKVQRTFVPGHIKCTSLTCMGVPMMVQVYSSIKLFREAVDAVGDMKLGRISVGRTQRDLMFGLRQVMECVKGPLKLLRREIGHA